MELSEWWSDGINGIKWVMEFIMDGNNQINGIDDIDKQLELVEPMKLME